VSGAVLGLLAAVSGGPLGEGRLAAVGPSAWQVGAVSALEIGVAAAVTAGAANYLILRRAGKLAPRTSREGTAAEPLAAARSSAAERAAPGEESALGHVIYLDPWAGDPQEKRRGAPGPSALP
jgi:hypothetical protein